MKKQLVSALCACAAACLTAGDAVSVINLPAPDKAGGKPLMQAITERKTGRSYAQKEIQPQHLSNILYAAWGINRADGHRTIPTALNRQDLEVYALFPAGVYRYDALNHALVLWRKGDLRGSAFVRPELPLSAPVVLVYVRKPDAKMKKEFSCAHAGSAYQNVYLVCASEGLSSVIMAGFDQKAMTEKMELPEGHEVLFAQCIGYPVK